MFKNLEPFLAVYLELWDFHTTEKGRNTTFSEILDTDNAFNNFYPSFSCDHDPSPKLNSEQDSFSFLMCTYI